MSDLPTHPASESPESGRSYEEFLEDIKGRIRTAQGRAARAINKEIIDVYWQIGAEILRRQQERVVPSWDGARAVWCSGCQRIYARRFREPADIPCRTSIECAHSPLLGLRREVSQTV